MGKELKIDTIVRAYLTAIKFLIADTARDPSFAPNHLLSYLAQDFIESAFSTMVLARAGALSAAKRELRFIIESSVKICYVQQKSHSSSVLQKLTQFDKHLRSPNISIKRGLNLGMLPVDLQEAFGVEIGRLYGETSVYVHLTPHQIRERIAAVDAGRTVGYESAVEIEDLNDLVSRGFAASLVLLMHSAPAYVAGDWLVDSDGSTVDSYFLASRFIAGMDGFFDHKSERQTNLSAIQTARAKKIAF